MTKPNNEAIAEESNEEDSGEDQDKKLKTKKKSKPMKKRNAKNKKNKGKKKSDKEKQVKKAEKQTKVQKEFVERPKTAAVLKPCLERAQATNGKLISIVVESALMSRKTYLRLRKGTTPQQSNRKKYDPVSRYQTLAMGWKKSKFLSSQTYGEREGRKLHLAEAFKNTNGNLIKPKKATLLNQKKYDDPIKRRDDMVFKLRVSIIISNRQKCKERIMLAT